MPISIISGLLSAISWGTGDFLGGLTSKKSTPLAVTVVMEFLGVLLLFAFALLWRDPLPSATGAGWAIAAGIAGALGLLLLYTGLSSGTMGVVAPISGVVGASVPILFAALTLGAPSLAQTAGFALALAAVWLLAGGSIREAHLSTLVTPMVAGLGFGFFYVFMARVGDSGFFWPLAISRLAAGLALLGWGLLGRQKVAPPRSLLPAVAAVALFDTGGNLFYLLAAQTGRLDTAAVLSSLYPGMTVLLAWLFLHEQLSRPQWAGVAAAMLAIPLIVA